MSSEGENNKKISSEGDEKKNDEVKDTSQKMEVDKAEKENDKSSENGDSDSKSKESSQADESMEKVNAEPKSEDGKGNNEKDSSMTEKDIDNDTKSEDTSEKDEDENDKDEDKKNVPLLDQPLELSGTRERKKVQRFNDDSSTEPKDGAKTEIPSGAGTPLGEIPRIDASISRFKNDDLKLLHRLLFKTIGKTTQIKKNIRKFNGFDFAKGSEDYNKKISSVQKFEVKQLKSICEMLDLEKKGSKDEITERIIEFLIEPKDSGKPVGGGRPKRTAAVRANNRGYSSHDDSYSSDERPSPRGRRDKGKRSNLKDESSSESDEEFRPSDASDEKPRSVKRKRGTAGKKAQSDDDDVSDVDESPSSEESEDEPKSKRKKVVNSKAKGKVPAAKRGRKPAAVTTPATSTPAAKKKATPAKRGRKPAQNSSEESEPQEEEGSSSEDEPLVKKPKNPQPPTDEEIKSYVKDILEGANLEEITMKTVCKQVYAHYPDFDLTHKKDYIKTTVKSLIST